MVLTMKLTTFAWNVYDGRRKTEVHFRVLNSSQCFSYADRNWTNGNYQNESRNIRACLHSLGIRQCFGFLFFFLPIDLIYHHKTDFIFPAFLWDHTLIFRNTWKSSTKPCFNMRMWKQPWRPAVPSLRVVSALRIPRWSWVFSFLGCSSCSDPSTVTDMLSSPSLRERVCFIGKTSLLILIWKYWFDIFLGIASCYSSLLDRLNEPSIMPYGLWQR